MNPGRWRVATGALLPLLPAVLLGVRPLDEGSSVVLLLTSVVAACWIGGVAAGIAAAVLAGFVYDLLVLPPHFSLQVAPALVPHLVAFVLTAALVVALYARVRSSWRHAEQGRLNAESRARALGERVEMLAPLLDRAPVGFALVDNELRYRYVNQQLADFDRIPVDEHLGRRPTELFAPEVAAVVEPPLRRVLDTGDVQHHVTMSIERPGGTRHYLSSRYPVRDADGRIVGVAVSLLDTTEQVALQQDLTKALAELSATIESSPLAIALIDTDLRFKRVNRVFQQLSARPGRSLIGQDVTAADLLPPVVAQMCREVLLTGTHRDAPDVVTTADGDTTADDAERHLAISCFPVRLGSGDVVAIALVVLDVTERHRLARLESEAQTLRATAEMAFKLEEAQRLAGFGSWEMDLATGEITWSKQMRAIAGDVDRYLNEGATTVVHPDDVERAAELRRRLQEESIPYAEELRLVRKDGSVIEVYATGEAIRDETGRPVRLWGTLQDITERRSAERAAQAARRSAEQARAQLEAEHQALQMFLRTMLPASLPKLPDAQLAAEYLPVAERVDIGGDWYDAFMLPDGRLALAVGDVTGHDVRAATVMGQVRNAVRAYATEDPTPGHVLRRVNALLNRVPELDLVTMLYGVYDPVTHELRWANAGHPAPLLRRGGRVESLTRPGGLLLGVLADDAPYNEASRTLEPGDTVLWYTDGLIDHRFIDPTEALATLTGVIAGSSGEPARLLADITGQMLAGGVQEDDVCLLVLHRPASPAQTAVAGPAAAEPAAAEPAPAPAVAD